MIQSSHRCAPCRLLIALASTLLCCHPAAALPDWPAMLPEHQRVEGLKSPEEFFGFALGERHLRHDQAVDYMEYLAAKSDRAALVRYGRTHGRRPLVVLVVTSPERSTQLDAVRAARPALTRSDDPPADETPLVMTMCYCVHGDEASAMNAAPAVAWHLASSLDESVMAQLEAGVYLVDPALNPDGADRFANWANENRGRFASDSIHDREHNQPWPGGRTNYYWFDLNRDWLPATHPESRGRLKLFHQWKPNVVLDFHEMRHSSTYFFQPGVPERNNPLSPQRNLELTRAFALRHAEAMDRAGELYFTEEQFDDFYPGKGSTYPDLHGAVGILFEQGSTRGKRIKAGPIERSFRDSIANQVRTSLSSLRAALELKSELLTFQHDFYTAARREAADDPVTAYLLTGTPSRLAAAAQLLKRHDIAAYGSDGDVTIDGQKHAAANVLIVPTGQPEYTLIKSLMTPLETFRENIFYDVSTWHLPSAMDVGCVSYRSDLPEAWLAGSYGAATESADVEPVAASNAVGLVFSPTELEAPKLAVRLMRMDARLSVATAPITIDGPHGRTVWPRGSFLMLKQHNEPKWRRLYGAASALAPSMGVPWRQLTSGMTATGPDLGSNRMRWLPKCEPLLVVGDGTSSYSAGSLWHFLDVRLRQPTLLADAGDLGRSGLLDDRTCVVLPSGGYGSVGESAVDRLKEYVREGGTVIAVASAIRWLDREGLIKLPAEPADGEKPADEPSSEPPAFADAGDQRALEQIAGVFLSTQVDPTHPLAYGFPDAHVPVFRNHSNRFLEHSNPYRTAARYDGVIAGYVSDRNRARLQGTAAAWVVPSGRGRYILLADEPTFRGYVRSSERFLTNAMLLGPTMDVPPAPIGDGG